MSSSSQNEKTTQSQSNTAAAHDDSFELYDLRVEVVCPPGEKIMCGAKEGDYFTLQGEMLYLPEGQGMSIYSLGEFFFHFFIFVLTLSPSPSLLLSLTHF